MRSCFVYILANRYRTVFYTGMTNDLARRMAEHRAGRGSQFTARYRIRALVYYEVHPRPLEAIRREKTIKQWRRSKKIALIQSLNPRLTDLYIPRSSRHLDEP